MPDDLPRRRFLRALGLGAVGLAGRHAAPRWPVSDHCDGTRFFNLDPNADAGRRIGEVLKWATSRTPAPWPEWVADPAHPFPETVPDGGLAVTFLGHASFLLRLGDLHVLTDPVFSTHAGPFGRFGPKRVRAPGLPLERLPRIDLVLQSHNHYDHLDPGTLEALAGRGPLEVITPLGNADYLPRRLRAATTELDWWDGTTTRQGTRVTAIPAQHFSARTPFDRNRALWGGFVLDHAGWRVCFAGDTGYAAHFRDVGARFPGIDLALLPIGAYDPRWFMRPAHADPEEAVQAHLDLGAARSLAMHHGTFQLTDEPIDEPVARLAAETARRGLAPDAFTAPPCGATLLLERR